MNSSAINEVLTDLNQQWNEFKQSYQKDRDRIGMLEAQRDSLGRVSDSDGGNERKQREALAGFLKSNGTSRAAPDEWMAASSPGYQKKAMVYGTDADGGHAVPEVLENAVVRRLAELSPLRQVARIITPATAFSSYKIPVSLGGTASGWVGETDARPNTATPTLDVPAFPDGELYANPKASQQVIDDWAAGTLEKFLADECAEAFARQEGTAFVTGNGTKKPIGFLNATPVATDDNASPARSPFVLEYVPLAPGSSPANIVYADGLIDVAHTLKVGYWAGASWLMNRTTLAAIRKLRDDNGQFLWSPSLAPGQPAMLLGFPVLLVDAMPNVGTNAFPIALGDWARAYAVLDKPTRLLIDPYSDKPNVSFYWTKRVSGHIVDSHAAKVGKNAAT